MANRNPKWYIANKAEKINKAVQVTKWKKTQYIKIQNTQTNTQHKTIHKYTNYLYRLANKRHSGSNIHIKII